MPAEMPSGLIDTAQLSGIEATSAHLHNRRLEREGLHARLPHTRPANASQAIAHTNTASPEVTTHPLPITSDRPVSVKPAHEGGELPPHPAPEMPEHVTPLDGAVKSGMVPEAARGMVGKAGDPAPSHPGLKDQPGATVRNPATPVPHRAGQAGLKAAPVAESNEPGHIGEEEPAHADLEGIGSEPKDVLEPVKPKGTEVVTHETHEVDGKDVKTEAVEQPGEGENAKPPSANPAAGPKK